MNVNTSTMKCPQCGAMMKQQGSDGTYALYHCSCCGHNATVAMGADTNAEYFAQRTELCRRAFVGVADWQTTQWSYLRRDILDFMGRHDQAKYDLQLNVALLAGITNGFHHITAETYKECKTVYKLTKKLHKILRRQIKQTPDAKKTEESEEYCKHRASYLKCRNDYLGTKLAWKALFSILKKFNPLSF